MFSEKSTELSPSQKYTRTIYQKRVTFCNFGNRGPHRNNFAAPEEAITVGDNRRRCFWQRTKGKISSRCGLGVLLLLLRPLVSRDGAGATVDVGGGGQGKGKSADQPNLEGDNNAATKNKLPSSFLLFWPLVFVWMDKAVSGASNTTPILVLSLDLASIPLWVVFSSPLDGAAAVPCLLHPSSKISFETLCLDITL